MSSERVFNITPKHNNEWLTVHQVTGNSFRMVVAGDVIQNARELDPTGINWDEVVERYSCRQGIGDSRLKGKAAIAFNIVQPLAAMSIRSGWDMHTPEVVYASGVHFAKFLTAEVIQRSERVKQMEEGQIKFDPPEKRQPALQVARELRDRMFVYKESLDESLVQYAGLFLPRDERYLQILGTDLHRAIQGNAKRYEIFAFLGCGDIERAYDIFISSQRRGKSVSSYIPEVSPLKYNTINELG